MDATITGVERFGLFCQGVEIPVDGLVHITALDRNDYLRFRRSRPSAWSPAARVDDIGWATAIRVKVAHVDVDRRGLDFAIVPEGKKGSRNKPSRGSNRLNRGIRGRNDRIAPPRRKSLLPSALAAARKNAVVQDRRGDNGRGPR